MVCLVEWGNNNTAIIRMKNIIHRKCAHPNVYVYTNTLAILTHTTEITQFTSNK